MEWQLFEPGTIPEYTTPEWYAGRERAPHLEESGHRWRLETAAGYVAELATLDDPGSVVIDLGAGDGGLLSLVKERTPCVGCWGYDLQESNVRAARTQRNVAVYLLDVVTEFDDVYWGPPGRRIAVCTEMLEHLVDPHGFLKRVAERADYVVASSPATETAESHYEFHTWAWDEEGYFDLLTDAGFEVRRHATEGMFQVIMGKRR